MGFNVQTSNEVLVGARTNTNVHLSTHMHTRGHLPARIEPHKILCIN